MQRKKFYAESFKGEMWDKISFKISHLRLSLYILDPFCCFIALATVVEKNLSRAFVWTFMVITIQAPKSTIGSFSFCLIGEFRASSNPCSEFLLTTKLRSNVFLAFCMGDSWQPPWGSQLCFDHYRAGLLVSLGTFVMHIAFCSNIRVHKHFVELSGSLSRRSQKSLKDEFRI